MQQSIIEGRRSAGCAYEVFNDDTGDSIYCDCRSDVSDLIGYSEISLKNMVGNGRKIALGPYAGYQIRNLCRTQGPRLIMAIRVVRN